MIWVYDGSYEGLLTAVFEWYERKPGHVELCASARYNQEMFTEPMVIHTISEKAERVKKAYQTKLDNAWNRRLSCCWLSESPAGHNHLFHFLIELFSTNLPIYKNYGNEHVLRISKLARSVEREKHRMEAFIRFEKMADGLFYAKTEPDFNVLPLISKHFKDRYSDQAWLIYDMKRNYGLYYDTNNVTLVSMEKEILKVARPSSEKMDETELKYQDLWKNYFVSTNIEARKNTKLHIQHVPRRYHKYLTELR